jgi:hypothetical protein
MRRVYLQEIESWKGFEYALCKLNATLFNKMLKECLENKEYASACIQNQRATVFAEALFMALIFQQQKMIGESIMKMGSDQKI